MEIQMKKLLALCFLFTVYVANASTDTLLVDSNAFKEKQTITVKLPHSYKHLKSRSYPVIFVLHGQWDTKIVTATVNVMENEIPEFIVIGIHAKGDKLQPVNNNINIAGKQFRRYLNHELLPFINKNYRTADHTILVGHSNAGRFALEQLLNNNAHFNDYFVFSPSLEDGYLTSLASNASNLKGKLFLSVANEGEHMQVPFEQISTTLKQQKALSVKTKEYPQYSHQSSKIIGLVDAFKFRFSHFRPTRDTQLAGFDSLMSHYKKLEQEFGFKPFPNKDDLVRLIAYFATQNNAQEIAKLSGYLKANYNDAKTSLTEIKEYLSNNNFQSAAELITP